MRNEKRIPIVLELMLNKDILSNFLNNKSLHILNKITNNCDEIKKFWLENPDLRFGQLLCNLRLIPNIDMENHIWNIEEDNWLIDNYYCKLEDIKFWDVNFYKNGKKRKKIKYVLLKDLRTDHIINIIKFLKKINSLDKLNSKYLEYFNKRIND